MAAIALLWLLAVGVCAFNLVISGLYPAYDTFCASLVSAAVLLFWHLLYADQDAGVSA